MSKYIEQSYVIVQSEQQEYDFIDSQEASYYVEERGGIWIEILRNGIVGSEVHSSTLRPSDSVNETRERYEHCS